MDRRPAAVLARRRTLAFTSDRENETAQVWLLPMEGGDARRLTEFKRGVTEFEWMPERPRASP